MIIREPFDRGDSRILYLAFIEPEKESNDALDGKNSLQCKIGI